MAPARAEDLLRRFDQLERGRANWNSLFQELRDNLYPSAGAFIAQDVAGTKTHQKIFDSTPEQAAELLAAFLHGLLTNPAVKWFSLRALDDAVNEDEEAAIWLEDATRRMYAVFNRPTSRFAAQQTGKYLDLVNFGSAAMFIGDRPGRGPTFSTRPMSECYFGEDHEGVVDTVFRCFKMTARQAAQKWPDNLPAKMAAAAGSPAKQDDEFDILHAVFPRAIRDRGSRTRTARDMPVASVYLARDEKHILAEGGFDEMPYVTPRWTMRPGEVYGRSPGMKVLADAKMLQRGMKSVIRAAEKTIDPPLLVPDDGVLSPVRLTSSGVTTVRSDLMAQRADPIRPLTSGARPDLGEDWLEGIRERIRRGFFSHLMQIDQDPRMTATQVLELAEKTQQAIGPQLGRMQVEDLGPMIDRVFAVMQRGGAFPPPPAVLEGVELDVEYVSPIARLQRLSEARAITQTVEVSAPFIQADATVLDNIDADRTFRHLADLFGWPKDTLRPREAVADVRRARVETTEQEIRKADALAAADAAGKVVPLLQRGAS